MSTAKHTPIELAKQGNPHAIATLINHQLQPKGITVKVTFHKGCLNIMLESLEIPDQSISVSFIKKGVVALESHVIKQVKMRGHRIGAKSPAWIEEFENPYVAQKLLEIESSLSSDNLDSSEGISPSNIPSKIHNARRRIVYQFLQVRVQLLGRGMTNEIMNLYVNGKRLRPKVRTMHEFMNYLGALGFKIVTAELETEGIYTHFYTFQREAYTRDAPPEEDIFDLLARTNEGADFGDSVRQMLEFGLLGDNL